MPRPRNALGRPGTRVIPTDWETAHAPVVAKTFTARCRIYAAETAPTIGDDLTYQAADPTLIYDDACRVQAWTGDTTVTRGDQTTTRSAYLLAIGYDADDERLVGAVVDVHDSNDPVLNAGRLVVERVRQGTLRFERDLFCVLDEGI